MDAHPLILVVEDDREIRSLLSDYLAANGLRTAEAADGAAMWKALDAARIDLIVLDLMMPGEDGSQLCRTLRAKSNLPVMVAQFSLPGLARAVSTKSFTVLMSEEEGTTTATMVLEMRAMGARSRSSSLASTSARSRSFAPSPTR
jgi:CheY-like chemotaxis protein